MNISSTRIALALGSVAIILAPLIVSAADWRGAYEPYSRACSGSRVVISEKAVRYGRITYLITETLVNSESDYAVVVRSDVGAGSSTMVISLAKDKGTDLVYREFQSRDYWKIGEYQAYCIYGVRH